MPWEGWQVSAQIWAKTFANTQIFLWVWTLSYAHSSPRQLDGKLLRKFPVFLYFRSSLIACTLTFQHQNYQQRLEFKFRTSFCGDMCCRLHPRLFCGSWSGMAVAHIRLHIYIHLRAVILVRFSVQSALFWDQWTLLLQRGKIWFVPKLQIICDVASTCTPSYILVLEHIHSQLTSFVLLSAN